MSEERRADARALEYINVAVTIGNPRRKKEREWMSVVLARLDDYVVYRLGRSQHVRSLAVDTLLCFSEWAP